MHRHLLITGLPGVGKTTLVQAAIEQLKDTPVSGFFTEEVRGADGRRSGFDVVTLTGKRAPLARVGGRGGPSVGQYTVDVPAFERLALPALDVSRSSPPRLLVIDEIGKMELFSSHFQRAVRAAFASDATIVATVPVPRGKMAPLLAQLRERADTRLLEVTRQNRQELVSEVVRFVKERVKA